MAKKRRRLRRNGENSEKIWAVAGLASAVLMLVLIYSKKKPAVAGVPHYVSVR